MTLHSEHVHSVCVCVCVCVQVCGRVLRRVCATRVPTCAVFAAFSERLVVLFLAVFL